MTIPTLLGRGAVMAGRALSKLIKPKQKTTGTEVISGVTKKPRSDKSAKLGELKVATHKLKGQMKRLKDVGDNIKDYMSNK
jgi:hypothetical protein